ncbi:hypothetical protein B0H99_101389 [Planomicrobium soli]|uniref:Uncharacterized protein n=1 Tax=Planomicrobium soli TaxID=1176648 RepID=A0A2P8H7G7_9BACL|nr:hypothetical protein B0H99_101389 [Planomicrobium soli]
MRTIQEQLRVKGLSDSHIQEKENTDDREANIRKNRSRARSGRKLWV